MKKYLLLIFLSSFLLASVNKNNLKIEKDLSIKVLKILNTNKISSFTKERLLKEEGLVVLQELKNLYKSESVAFKNRWLALMFFAKLAPKKEALKGLKEASFDRQWFIRSAALKAFGFLKEKEGLNILHESLNDKSLVVRTSAVDAISQIKDKSSVKELKKALYDEKNFHRNKSLWIRNHIVDALLNIGGPAAISLLITLLEDKDEKISQRALTSLNKITGNNFAANGRLAMKNKYESWFSEKYKNTNF